MSEWNPVENKPEYFPVLARSPKGQCFVCSSFEDVAQQIWGELEAYKKMVIVVAEWQYLPYPEADESCKHSKKTPEHDHIRCNLCGCVKTDNEDDWG